MARLSYVLKHNTTFIFLRFLYFSCNFIIFPELIIGPVTNYHILAGSTRRCPGHYIKIIKCIVRAKVARKVSPKVLHLLFNKLKQTFPTAFVFKFFA